MEKLYGFESFFSIGEIEEWDIVKVTPKTYVVKKTGGSGFERIVRKNEMSVGQITYATSYEAAVKAKREKIIKRIEAKTSENKRRELEIQKLEEQLKELDKEAK